MAIIRGTDFDDDIDGYNVSDDIYGYDGDDDIFAYDGNDDIYAGYDNDYVAAGEGADRVYGEAGNDALYGQGGHDDLYGGTGNDKLSGGTGDDWLVGGSGRDYLTSGTGYDTFVFTRGSSGLSSSTADYISDWNASYDLIDTAVRGTSTNYREARTSATSIATAADQADAWYPSTSVKHVFLYNSTTDKGYLVSDLNSDGVFETGVVLNYAGFASDFSYLDLV